MLNDLPFREPSRTVPSYRQHKPSGQAVVTLSGRDIYLGKYGTNASRAEYDRLIGEWPASGRCLPRPAADMTVAELAIRFWRFACGHYRKGGAATSEVKEYGDSLRPVRQMYGATLVSDFGPIGLKAVRQTMVEAGLSRGTVK